MKNRTRPQLYAAFGHARYKRKCYYRRCYELSESDYDQNHRQMGGFVLRSKDNQRNLKRDVENFFEEVLNSPQKDFSIQHTHTVDKDHGSAVTRDYYSATNLDWMICKDGRTSLNSVGTAISAIICEEITMRECRYFVSSLTDGNVSAKATRSHWGDWSFTALMLWYDLSWGLQSYEKRPYSRELLLGTLLWMR